jgi:predicted nuclease with TOPRIM domain
LNPFLQKATEDLQARIQWTQQENATLSEKINQQRAEIEQLLSILENSVKEVEDSVEAMHTNQSAGFENLRNETWQMEQEIVSTR